MKLKYDEALSSFAFNLNVRRYTMAKYYDQLLAKTRDAQEREIEESKGNERRLSQEVHTPHTSLTHPSYTPHTPLTHPSHPPHTPLTHLSYTPHTPFTHPNAPRILPSYTTQVARLQGLQDQLARERYDHPEELLRTSTLPTLNLLLLLRASV